MNIILTNQMLEIYHIQDPDTVVVFVVYHWRGWDMWADL